jgi:tRNA A-37 threonylcarbamoyl transferase component Bud32
MMDFFVEPDYKTAFEQLGLTSIEAVFAFQGVKNLTKANLAPHRSRIEFRIELSATTLFLKRYDRPPVWTQLKNWLSAKKRISCAYAEFKASRDLQQLGINVPRMVAWGEQRGVFFEKRSFVIIEKVEEGVSLEKRLPDFFNGPATPENLKMRRRFIKELAVFVRKFHETGFRHRDLYLSHIFWTRRWEFCLIDLARAFRPLFFSQRYRIKDLAQLHYSAPGKYFSKTDRLRFLRAYLDSPIDGKLAKRINDKAKQIARHDVKHGKAVPFAT